MPGYTGKLRIKKRNQQVLEVTKNLDVGAVSGSQNQYVSSVISIGDKLSERSAVC